MNLKFWKKKEKKDLFVWCSHCGGLVDVNASIDKQMKEGRLIEYDWGIGASRMAIDAIKNRGS